MSGGDGAPLGAGRCEAVPYSDEVGEALCARVAAGEMLQAVCREAGMPTTQSVRRWARDNPEFGEALAEARRAAGRSERGGGVWRYTEELADEIYDRLCEGESLTAIARDPAMPCLSTLHYWRRKMPEFEEIVRQGRKAQAERFCDLGWEMAMEATPQTAYLTEMRLKHLRWTAGVMSPRQFRTKLTEPESAPEVLTYIHRHFAVEVNKATGEKRVVAWRPDSRTGQPLRETPLAWPSELAALEGPREE